MDELKTKLRPRERTPEEKIEDLNYIKNSRFRNGSDMRELSTKLGMDIKEFAHRIGRCEPHSIAEIEQYCRPLKIDICRACETMARGEYLGSYDKARHF